MVLCTENVRQLASFLYQEVKTILQIEYNNYFASTSDKTFHWMGTTDEKTYYLCNNIHCYCISNINSDSSVYFQITTKHNWQQHWQQLSCCCSWNQCFWSFSCSKPCIILNIRLTHSTWHKQKTICNNCFTIDDDFIVDSLFTYRIVFRHPGFGHRLVRYFFRGFFYGFFRGFLWHDGLFHTMTTTLGKWLTTDKSPTKQHYRRNGIAWQYLRICVKCHFGFASFSGDWNGCNFC